MEVSSTHQIYVFTLYVISGMMCGAFFDIQRFLRKLHRAGNARTQLEDILFAILCIGIILTLSYFFNNGEIRYYQLMGCVSGALFYMAALSRIFTKILYMAFKCIKNLLVKPLVKICVILYIPVRKFTVWIKEKCRRLKKIISGIKRNIKKRKKRLKKRIKML